MEGYQDFINSKFLLAKESGFDLPIDALNPESYGEKYQFQPHIVQWQLRLGRSGCYANYGRGKTRMQLEWAKHTASYTDARTLILAPLAVAEQTVSEGEKFRIQVDYAESAATANRSKSSIIITNYDRLDKLEPVLSQFKAIALDESSILKNWTGKTKQFLCDWFKGFEFKSCYSALPAPNNPLEWQGQAEFLEIQGWDQLLTRFFIRNSMKAGDYKLKPHSRRDFWRWISSWAVCLNMPSDLGFSDEGWDLPPLNVVNHIIPVDHTMGLGEECDRDGQLTLIRTPSNSATTVHKEQKKNAALLARKVAEIIENEPDETWQIWTFTDYEVDELEKVIPGLTILRGSETRASKHKKLTGYSQGIYKRFSTKPEIAGLGMNWQHCHKVIFVMGSSYSFEQYHQALHRNYRNGQTEAVDVHRVFAETAGNVQSRLVEKEHEYKLQQIGFRQAVAEQKLIHCNGLKLDDYEPQVIMEIPSWAQSKTA